MTEADLRHELEEAGVSSLFSARVTPDAIVVLEVPARLTEARVARLHALLAELFPRNRALILDEGMTLKVVQPVAPASPVAPPDAAGATS